ncbi:MAG: AAA family ATPase [Bacteriovoracaceae bacterium]|nr:AAA family ATPase [Bacteriovoracaceae bacterium]
MFRQLQEELAKWESDQDHKPLILRGARQVGKSYLIREFSTSFYNFVELNFEQRPGLISIFEQDLDPSVIVKKIIAALDVDIVPGKTLLFFDEIQECPRAITALRYFYEQLPKLHVVSAGSLLDFTLEDVGIPVGRVRSLYVYPMNFYEFLHATGNKKLYQFITDHDCQKPMDLFLHDLFIGLFGEYMAVGGMPEAVKKWIDTKDLKKTKMIHNDLIETYRQDFSKYAKAKQVIHVEKLFSSIPRMLTKKFTFTSVDKNTKARDLKPALDLLIKAGIVHSVVHSSSNAIPLGAEANPSIFKMIFLDIALSQTILGIDLGQWILNPSQTISNIGEVTESFVGQELLAYSNPYKKMDLFYWNREKRNSMAEVDYVIGLEGKVVPIEVKSGKTGTLKSMQQFLKEKAHSQFGLQFSKRNFDTMFNIHNYPLYSIFKLFI